MVIYGVALLSICLLIGLILGDILGTAIGVQANVGGVGIAMLFLIVFSNLSKHTVKLQLISQSGVTFWSAMYIPIVVAMAGKQNVVAAVSNGWLAVVAGLAAVTVSFAMIPLLSRMGKGSDHDA